MTLKGQIIKGIGGFYYVRANDSVYTLKAPGRFRKEKIKPVVGDIVEFDDNDCAIKTILPRRNLFYRPAVANVTQGIIVMTGSYPKADLYLIDKLIIQCELADINIVLAINKCDDTSDEDIQGLKKQFSYYEVICCSTITGDGIEKIKSHIKGNVTFFAGQSGVGKSSIVNAVVGDNGFATGEISEKLKRGKHTTRHVELVYIPDLDGAILDTPGFSFYDFKDDFNLEACYREFKDYRNDCRYNCCTHTSEPECAVKERIGKEISSERYERYVQMCKIQQEMRDKRYD